MTDGAALLRLIRYPPHAKPDPFKRHPTPWPGRKWGFPKEYQHKVWWVTP